MQCSPRLMGGEAVRKLSILSGINSLKRVTGTWKMMKELIFQDLIEPMKMLKKYRIWYIQIDFLSTKIIMWK
jgi:hypothetical protein